MRGPAAAALGMRLRAFTGNFEKMPRLGGALDGPAAAGGGPDAEGGDALASSGAAPAGGAVDLCRAVVRAYTAPLEAAHTHMAGGRAREGSGRLFGRR